MKSFLSKTAREIAPYTAGEQPSDKKYVKLNTNENPYPPSPKALEAYQNFDFSSLKLYPPLEMKALRSAIAAAEGVSPENVFCGNGSDEILALCFPAFFDEGGAGAAFADVTYSFYPVFADFFKIPKKKSFRSKRILPSTFANLRRFPRRGRSWRTPMRPRASAYLFPKRRRSSGRTKGASSF